MKKRLLLVDDDITFLEGLRDSSLKLQYELDIANTFDEAVSQTKKNKHSAYIIDIDLNSSKDGFFLGDQIKIKDSAASIIIISNTEGNDPIAKTLHHRFDHFFVKSSGYEKLAEMIEKVLKQEAENINYERLKNDIEKYGIITKNDKMLKTLSQVTDLKDSTNILIEGESGTGKELVAKYLGSILAPNKPFITVNCPATPITLMESVLFGYVKGAFTGADKDSTGKFGEAEGGVIFLDEISCASLDMQQKLLRVIQNQELERVGSAKKIKCNVKIIASTNENLENKIKKHEFREDLFFRLKRHAITLPPLRERKDDIELLINYFAKNVIDRFTEEVIKSLQNYSWPGNVRELENVVYDLLVKTKDKNKIILKDILYLFHSDLKNTKTVKLPEEPNIIQNGDMVISLEEAEKNGLSKYLKKLEERIILKEMDKCKNISECSYKLKIDLSYLCKKIKKYKSQ